MKPKYVTLIINNQPIISHEFVQNYVAVPKAKKNSNANEQASKSKAFDYVNSDSKNTTPSKLAVLAEPVKNAKTNKGKYDIKELLTKVKEHAKVCKDKPINKSDMGRCSQFDSLDLDQFEKVVDRIIEDGHAKNGKPN